MKLSWRILTLVLVTVSGIGTASFFLTNYQQTTLHNDSEKLLAKTVVQSLRDALVQDVIDNNKLRVTNLLKNLQSNDNPIDYLYITTGDHSIFAHSFTEGFPRYLLHQDLKHFQAKGIYLENKYQTNKNIIYEYAQALIPGLDAVLHIGINQTEITSKLNKNSQLILSASITAMLIALLVAYIWSRQITSPISNLSEKIKLFGSGEDVELSSIKTSSLEITQLVAAFQIATTERQLALNSLREREQNLSVTLNSIGDAVITTDFYGNVTRMNPVAEKLTGWKLDEAKNKSLKTIFPIVNASTRKTIENPVDKVLATGEIVYLSNHTTLISKDGTEYQIADSAAPIKDGEQIQGMILVFNDVTEQYHLREASTKTRKGLQAIMDNSPSVIYAKDIEGRYIFVNKVWRDLFTKDREDIIGKTDFEIFSEEFAGKFAANDKDVWEAGHALKSEETAPHDDGPHTYLSVKFPLLDENNKAYAICGISTDITETKQHEEQIRRSQKMDAMGKLTGGVAHDFNNMLGVILGYTDLLEDKLTNQPDISRYASEIRRAGERGAKLTQRLLSFSRHHQNDAEVLNINSLLLSEKDMLQKTITPRIDLIYDLSDELWTIYVDESDLEDAIVNMSINAMHAIENNGQLTIQTCNISLSEPEARLLQVSDGDYVALSIIDTGTGMDNETKEKIFEPFFSTKGDKGTGLGLSQVYGFVERSGGAIKVYSEVSHGTRLTLYFPRNIEEQANKPEKKTVKSKRNLNGTETILVVDDEPALVNLTSEILTQHNYNVLEANSAKQALQILEQEHIDLLLTDIIMPEVDGYQLVSIVQLKYPDIKIQLASGFSDERHSDMINDEHHSSILHKPFDSETLLKRLRQLLD